MCLENQNQPSHVLKQVLGVLDAQAMVRQVVGPEDPIAEA